MKKHLYRLLTAITALFIFYNASAQSDSLLDLGRVKLDKDFAQTITIKGKYLEQIPFSTISEVIAPWLQGTQNNRFNLVFVVDGNVVNDVNAWSIQDIEEITLVQDAVGAVNGANSNKQLVLVKTKRNHEGQQGFTVTGSSHLVKNKFHSSFADAPESETNFYHQYQVSAWKNVKNIRFGLTANYLRDVNPLEKTASDIATPYQLNRFRFNGWFDVTLAEGHSLSASINVTPQKNEYDYAHSTYILTSDNRRTLIFPSLKLSNRIAKGLTNELSVSYLTLRNPYEASATLFNLSTEFKTVYDGLDKNNNLLIRENLGYTTALGNWVLSPSVNLAYRSTEVKSRVGWVTYENGTPQGQNFSTMSADGKALVLTPSVGLSYKNIFSVMGGISKKIDDETAPANDGIFPFASLSLDVLRLAHPNSSYSLKIFGSYTKPADFGDNPYRISDLYADAPPSVVGSPIYTPGPISYVHPYPDDPTMQAIRAGATFALPGDRLQVSYNFDNRKFVEQTYYNVITPVGQVIAIIWPDYLFTAHRLGITGQVMDKGKIHWLAGVNVNTYKYVTKQIQMGAVFYPEFESNQGKSIWSGGITNRFQYDQFSFGLDMLYVLNDMYIDNFTQGDKKSDWRISNIYAGYQLQVKNKPLELFISGRNLVGGYNPNVVDNRRFYGAGFKLNL